MLFDRSTRIRSSSEKSLSYGRSFRCSRTYAADCGTPPNSTPIVTSNPLMDIQIICPSAPFASTSTSHYLPKGGVMIVDSTRKGKRFPDSMSKTIPIWTCVLNRAISYHRARLDEYATLKNESNISDELTSNIEQDYSGWDCSLHLPLWVSETEKAMIEARLEGWTKEFEASGADIASISLSLRKPLRPLWISQKTVIWLNEVPEYDSWDFTPVILISASSPSSTFQKLSTSEFSWNYIAGAGDDEESWARSLSPNLFWKNVYDLISSGPDLCNQKVANIVEKDRVYRAQRGENAPQVSVRPSKCLVSTNTLDVDIPSLAGDEKSSDNYAISWLGSTNIAVGRTPLAADKFPADSIINCHKVSLSMDSEACLHLPIVDSKFDRFSLLRNLPSALDFAKTNLRHGKTLLVCCNNGEDISICVCLAIFTLLYTDAGHFDDGNSFKETRLTKLELRKRLVFICKFAINARPSRGNLKQVFNYLSQGTVPSLS
ncbi:tRNA A64-2 -O-ribosylphosphate transferase isoform X2 [Olea europaea subsp. europaea]|uniref:tRNA A64-2 -O-ribosylphosphate transferase isoform X2 n=1 Tax=Olea europaea subsp. europaea TaxID=158383 RepID=A0A8S0QS56_OLEEU|nr:tRNA A64-2 -O-ribosylphosphate transferase isoform X2 [Olea europaea subsp. europaea]